MATIIRVDGTEEPLESINLDALQSAVGGYFERVALPDENDMLVNEEGLLGGLKINDRATDIARTVIVGDVVICDQLLDRTIGRPRTLFEHAAVHVEFAEPFCPVMRRWLLAASSALEDTTVHSRATYICIEEFWLTFSRREQR